jgi:hypothetical protein
MAALNPVPSQAGVERARSLFEEVSPDIELHDAGTLRAAGATLADLRRGRRRTQIAKVGSIALIERDGILSWQLGPATSAAPSGRRRVERRRGLFGRLIARKDFIALEPNQIGQYLDNLDSQLNPNRKLLEWNASTGMLQEPTAISTQKPILIVIHGTFSKGQHILDDLKTTPEGSAFLANAAATHQVLSFEHPTVSVSPMLNALDLRNALGDTQVPIDIVCHSRGGLVARWWMEALDPYPQRPKQCVFVASPLNGTSLASPACLRAGLDAMANLASILGNVAMAIPLMKAPAAILRVIGSVVGVGSKLPLVDAALAMIPGLAGQSRTNNNPELLRLNRGPLNQPRYFFIKSDFQNADAGWDICRRIRERKLRAAEMATDLFIFPDKNDLVVDYNSMTEIPEINLTDKVWDFGTNGDVHHTNYFQKSDTVNFISKSLGIVPPPA